MSERKHFERKVPNIPERKDYVHQIMRPKNQIVRTPSMRDLVMGQNSFTDEGKPKVTQVRYNPAGKSSQVS